MEKEKRNQVTITDVTWVPLNITVTKEELDEAQRLIMQPLERDGVSWVPKQSDKVLREKRLDLAEAMFKIPFGMVFGDEIKGFAVLINQELKHRNELSKGNGIEKAIARKLRAGLV